MNTTHTPREHTYLNTFRVGSELATVITRVDQDGNENVEITGVHEILDLELMDYVPPVALPTAKVLPFTMVRR